MKTIKRIFRGNFVRHFLTLSSGTVVAQILPVAASPFLTRLYSPGEIGGYLSILAIAAIVSTFAALRYDAALAQVKFRKQARALVFLGAMSCILICAISGLLALGLMWIGALPEQFTKLGFWILAIPLLTLGNCLQAMLVNINIRHKAFQAISIATVQKACVLVVVQVLLGGLGRRLACRHGSFKR
jgi:O-antigen/teichoic acid export membrane protein